MVTVSVSPATIIAGGDASFVIATSAVDPSRSTTVRYTMLGTAQLGSAYSLSGLPGEATIPAGVSSTQVVLHSVDVPPGRRRAKRATMKLLPNTSYRLSISSKKAAVTITGR